MATSKSLPLHHPRLPLSLKKLMNVLIRNAILLGELWDQGSIFIRRMIFRSKRENHLVRIFASIVSFPSRTQAYFRRMNNIVAVGAPLKILNSVVGLLSVDMIYLFVVGRVWKEGNRKKTMNQELFHNVFSSLPFGKLNYMITSSIYSWFEKSVSNGPTPYATSRDFSWKAPNLAVPRYRVDTLKPFDIFHNMNTLSRMNINHKTLR